MKKHTLGPWKTFKVAGQYEICVDLVACPSAKRTFIASTFGDKPNDRANARLIAAAPELLEALKTLRNAYRLKRPQIFGTDAVEELVIAVIKEAEGR